MSGLKIRKERPAFELLENHIHIGYATSLLLFDALLLLLPILDIWRFGRTGRSISAAVVHSLTNNIASTTQTIFYGSLLLIIILPIGLAAARLLSYHHLVLPAGLLWLGRRHWMISAIHILASILISYSVSLGKSMAYLSGYEWRDFVAVGFAFFPFTNWVFGNAYVASAAIIGIIGSILASAILKTLLDKGALPGRVISYWELSRLAYIGRELAPTHGRRKFNFNVGAIAPEIRGISKRARVLFSKYQRSVPGSHRAMQYANDLTAKCKALLIETLFNSKISDFGRHIELFPGTSRALEIAISRLPTNCSILVSPYEHPTEWQVASWISQINAKTFKYDVPKLSDLKANSAARVSIVSNFVMNAVNKKRNGDFALVLSHVCWANGLQLPVDEIIERIEKDLPNITMLVDGSHAIGNIYEPIRINDKVEYYFFSGHKWLLSPDPIGILISKKTPQDNTVPYDSWNGGLPRSTGSVRILTSLFAALEFIVNVSPGKLRDRAIGLRDQFIKETANSIVPLAPAEEQLSLVCSFVPKAGANWKFVSTEELSNYFSDNEISLKILDEYEIQPSIVRISFPFFVEEAEVMKLAKLVNRAIDKP